MRAKRQVDQDPVTEAMRLLRKNWSDWRGVVSACPSHLYFKQVVTMAVLRLLAEEMTEPNEAELARRANMNRTTLVMFMRRMGAMVSGRFFWGCEK